MAWGASAEVRHFECVYKKFHTYDDKGLQDANDFTLRFTIDTVTNKAFVVGNQGMEEVFLLTGSAGLTFLEYLPTGAVQTTTVSKNGSSVHSRHSLIGEEFSPSQYYGSCG